MPTVCEKPQCVVTNPICTSPLKHLPLNSSQYTSTAYPVESAFHGAVIYPYKQVVASSAKYDDGGIGNGQRCEHIGFNLNYCNTSNFPTSSTSTPYATNLWINPKWELKLDPARPGGPTGMRFVKLLVSMGTNIQCVLLFISNLFWHIVIGCLVAIVVLLSCKVWNWLATISICKKILVTLGINVVDVMAISFNGNSHSNGNSSNNSALLRFDELGDLQMGMLEETL